MKPGVRAAKSMPRAMPKVQSMATAASSRTLRRRDRNWSTRPVATAKPAAPHSGGKPIHAPSPTPPSEACAMPPPTMTNRRVTTYVPTTAQSTEASSAPSSACWKKVYSKGMGLKGFLGISIGSYRRAIGSYRIAIESYRKL